MSEEFPAIIGWIIIFIALFGLFLILHPSPTKFFKELFNIKSKKKK